MPGQGIQRTRTYAERIGWRVRDLLSCWFPDADTGRQIFSSRTIFYHEVLNIADEIRELKERIEKLESRMDFLFRRLGISLKEAPDWKASSKIIELVKKGDKKAAIREFMEESGASLKDAKTFIESIKA
jgi:ribosomal protein L7/L12